MALFPKAFDFPRPHLTIMVSLRPTAGCAARLRRERGKPGLNQAWRPLEVQIVLHHRLNRELHQGVPRRCTATADEQCFERCRGSHVWTRVS